MSKLLEVHPKNVIVTGSPGADLSVVALLLKGQGWIVSYSEQDLEVWDARKYDRYGFNVEVDRIHETLGERHSRFSDCIPDYHDTPYPGPREFILEFKGQPAVISSYCIAPRLDIWRPAADIVVNVRASEREDTQKLAQLKVPETIQSQIRNHQLSKLDSHLKLFPKVFTITNAEVKDRRFDALSSFLNSVF